MPQHWKATYTWRLRQIMAAHGMYNTSDLIPLLADYGITISRSQAHYLVTKPPERINLELLAALSHLLGVTLDELLEPEVHNLATKIRALGSETHPRRSPSQAPVRPVRVALTSDPPNDK